MQIHLQTFRDKERAVLTHLPKSVLDVFRQAVKGALRGPLAEPRLAADRRPGMF